jgi:pimeloyl-ACP methyl ester carboxylesterase
MQGYDTLQELRAFDDVELGIREEFLTPGIGGARTVAVLSTPLQGTPTIGWVICHSFALEQVDLQPLEARLARALAAAGFAVVRFHGQGYGDSQLGADHITLGSHLGEAAQVAELLVERTGVDRIGFMGARFGGMIAALVADPLGAAGLILWEPVVKGRVYMKGLALLSAMTELLTNGRSDSAGRPETMLEATDLLDVQGFPLRRQVFREVSDVDLPARLAHFRGEALILQISRSPVARTDLKRLAERLGELGGRCRLRIVTDEAADRFGQPRYRPAGDTGVVDTQATLVPPLISTTVSWARDLTMPERTMGDAPNEH